MNKQTVLIILLLLFVNKIFCGGILCKCKKPQPELNEVIATNQNENQDETLGLEKLFEVKDDQKETEVKEISEVKEKNIVEFKASIMDYWNDSYFPELYFNAFSGWTISFFNDEDKEVNVLEAIEFYFPNLSQYFMVDYNTNVDNNIKYIITRLRKKFNELFDKIEAENEFDFEKFASDNPKKIKFVSELNHTFKLIVEQQEKMLRSSAKNATKEYELYNKLIIEWVLPNEFKHNHD